MTKLIKTLLLVILLVFVTIAVAGFIKFNIIQDDIYIEQPNGSVVKANDLAEFVLVSEENTAALLSYTTPERDVVTLRIDGEAYELKSVVSGSGSKYASDDNSVIYWEHQNEATIELANETTYVIPTIKKADLLTFTIAPYKKDCVGVAAMKCLIVNGELFYDSIQGFEFAEGTEYEILVARSERENVPADASKYTYRFLETLDSSPVDAKEISYKDNNSMTVKEEVITKDKVKATPNALTEQSWEWKETQYNNDDLITPTDSNQFVARFSKEGQFSSSTDCNRIGGSYIIDNSDLSLSNLFSTEMACMGETMEIEYSNMLAAVTSYMIDDNGNLILMLKYDSGSMIFTPQTEPTKAQEAQDHNASRSNTTSS